MKQLYFWRQIRRILMFAVIGTLISTVVMALPLLLLKSTDWIPSLSAANIWAFAGLLSAVKIYCCSSDKTERKKIKSQFLINNF
jgi:NhaP-type Na+/H+ or K+/H+ antiporter